MTNTEDIFRGLGVEISFTDPKNFMKIKETLTRIGIPSKDKTSLYQSCHILHKQGRYAILHFKELFAMDGKETNFDEDDRARRNTIVGLLEEWNLLKVLNKDSIKNPRVKISSIKILSHKDKENWTLVPKYVVGKRKRTNGSTSTEMASRL